MTPNCSTCGYVVDYLRSCYRSVWRLNTDPAILTPGRFYFAPPGTPASPVASLRASRNYVAENGESFLAWGELDGKQKWDNGAPPIFVPLPRTIGTENCLTGEGNDPTGPTRESGFFRVVCIGGRDYHFPTLTYVSFSVARHDREFTYYNDVPLTLVDATCEARYEGPSGIPNTTAVLRVTDVPDGSLDTNCYLVDTSEDPPEPIETDCCGVPTPAVIEQTYRFYGSTSNSVFTPVWSILLEDLEMVYMEHCPIITPAGDRAGWYAFLDCDDQPTAPETCAYFIRKFCHDTPPGAWRQELCDQFTGVLFDMVNPAADFDCATGRGTLTLEHHGGSYGSGSICGKGYDATFGYFFWQEME